MIPRTLSQFLAGLKMLAIKYATFVLFFVLPQRMTGAFVGLSLLSLIYALREQRMNEDEYRLKKINRILNIHVNESILVSPRKSLNWYWGNHVINDTLTTIKGRELSLKEILVDNNILIHNRSMVTNHLLSSLPQTVQVKLKLDQVEHRVKIKHMLMGVLLTQPAF